jgi:hypothetical protein
MSIDNVDTTSLDNATKSATLLQSSMSLVGSTIQNVMSSMGEFGAEAAGGADRATAATNKYTNAIQSMISSMSNIDNKGFMDIMNGANQATLGVDSLSKKLLQVGTVAIKTDVFDDFKDSTAAGINAIDTHIGDLDAVMKKLSFPDSVIAGANNFFANAAAAEKMQNAFIGLAASTGTMNELFDENGLKLKNLSSLTATFTEMVNKSAAANGMDTKEVFGYASALGTIPGFMKSIITSGDGAATQTDGLTTAMKLMSGSGKSMGVVTDELTKGFEDLANANGKLTSQQSAQKSAEFFATISNAAQTLGLRFTDVQKVMNDVAQTFKFTGDNTAAAANILGRYSGALQSTGLTSQAAAELTGDMIKQVSGLTVAQKAYISSQSGGPGGLQGAFKLEEMMREGKTDQVMEMIEKVMRKKMGGNIVSLKEAANDPAAVAQFMKQRTMLQSGIFGIGKNSTDEQATHILEALKNKDTKSFAEMSGSKGLDTVMEKGNEIQKENNNMFKNMVQSLQQISAATALTAGMDIKDIAGTNSTSKNYNEQLADNAGLQARGQAESLAAGKTFNASNQMGAMGAGAMAGTAVTGGLLAKGMKDAAMNAIKPDINETLQKSMASHPMPGNKLMGNHSAATTSPGNAAHKDAMINHGVQNVNLHITVTTPDGLEVVAKSTSSNVKTTISNYNNLAKTPGMVPRGN